MSRRRYIVTYDVSDDKRRNEVFRTLLAHGDHAQYSVFFCDLSERELVQLKARLRGAIHHREDQVLVVDLGTASHPLEDGLDVLGRGYQPLVRTIVV
jgi:CRISPR-associated protein Cas2